MTGAKQGPLASDGSTSPAVDVFIRQLTGIRFVAAAWVVLYHFQVPLVTLGLLVPPMLDVIRVGRLGVDLFFALSGFCVSLRLVRSLFNVLP